MRNEKVYEWLKDRGFENRLTEHSETIDTVEHAAQQIGCTEARIAKTLSFIVDEKPVVVVMAGDGRVNSSKFKALFHTKPSMIPRDRVEEVTGFAPGGVCPFGVPADIPIWLDISIKRFEYVHPAGLEAEVRGTFTRTILTGNVRSKRSMLSICRSIARTDRSCEVKTYDRCT